MKTTRQIVFLVLCYLSETTTAQHQHLQLQVEDSLVLRASFQGIDVGPSPDAALAVGPHSLVVARNDVVAIMSKSGQLLSSKRTWEFFASVRDPRLNRLTDPYLMYDHTSGRFFFVMSDKFWDPDCTPGTCLAVILLAVSKNSKPQSLTSEDWYFYSFDRTINRLAGGVAYTAHQGDFDRLAIAGNHLAIVLETITFHEDAVGTRVRLFNKAKLLSGVADTNWVDITGFDMHYFPVVALDSIPDLYMLRVHKEFQPPGFFVRIYKISNLSSSPTLSSQVVRLADVAYESPFFARQPGNAPTIEIVFKEIKAVYRNGSIWMTRAIAKSYGNDTASAILWAQIDVSHWPDSVRVVQSGIISENGVDYFQPTLMVDHSNNVGLLLLRSSSSEFASLYYTGRLFYDSLGTLRTPKLIKAGTVYSNVDFENRNRLADFFSAALDPFDESMWFHAFYPKTSTFPGSWVSNIAFIVAVPNQPLPLAPADQATAISTRPLLRWQTSSKAQTYHLQVAMNPSFSPLIYEDSSLTVTSKQLTDLELNTKYYWRVRAKNPGGVSPWSSIWSFTTIIAPLPVVQTFTATSVTTIGATLRATVNPSGSSTTAWFEWGTSSALSTFSSTRVQTIGSDTNTVTLTAVLIGLNPATTYYYRVVAQNAGGIEHGTILSFTTNTVPLGEYLADTATVLLLHLNETTGSILVDASGNNNNGAATGTTIVSGRFDKGRSFLTAGDLITVPHSSSLNFGAGPFTIEMWVNTMGLANVGGNLFIKQGSNGRGYHAFVMSTGQVNVAVYNNGTNFLLTNKSITDGLWHHFAVVITQTSISIYIDGVLDNTTTLQTQGSTDNDALLLFGLQGGSPNPFRGVIDEIRISNKARTPQEFNTIYGFPPAAVTLAFPANGATEISKNPVLRWNSSKAATYYTLQVGTSSSFETPLVEQNWITDTSFALSSLVGETIYYWRVKANNGGGSSAYSPTWSFRTMGPVSVQQPASDVPREFSLSQNYPNPFNPSTTISFDIPRQSHVKLVVYDVLGREVRTLVDEEKQPGRYSVTFDASTLPSGVYLCRMMAGDFTHARKMVVMR
jgi:hypothetical protein